MDASGSLDRSLELVPSPTDVYRLNAGVTLRDIAAVLFRRKKIILAWFFTVLAGVAASVCWLKPRLLPQRYSSGLKFILKKDRFDAVVTPADRAVPGFTTSISAQEVQSQIELLKSADVFARVAREAKVASSERLGRDLIIEPVAAGRNTTNLIAVRYSAVDPAEVTRVLEMLPQIYLQKYLAVNRQPGALDYFRSQAESWEEQLRQAEGDLAEFDKQRPELGADGNREQARQKLLALEKQKSEMEAAIREAESRAGEIARQLGALPATVQAVRKSESSPYVERLKAELLDLENRRARETFYREIGRLDRRISEVRELLAQVQPAGGATEESLPNPLRPAVESELVRGRAQLAGLRSRLRSLQEQERTAREELSASRLITTENETQRAELVRHVKVVEEGYLLYRKKYAEAQDAEALDQKGVLNFAVAEGPQPPAPVEARGPGFYLAVGLVVAAGLSVSAGLGAELLDHSVHTPRQLENCSALAVLACIPESRVG